MYSLPSRAAAQIRALGAVFGRPGPFLKFWFCGRFLLLGFGEQGLGYLIQNKTHIHMLHVHTVECSLALGPYPASLSLSDIQCRASSWAVLTPDSRKTNCSSNHRSHPDPGASRRANACMHALIHSQLQVELGPLPVWQVPSPSHIGPVTS